MIQERKYFKCSRELFEEIKSTGKIVEEYFYLVENKNGTYSLYIGTEPVSNKDITITTEVNENYELTIRLLDVATQEEIASTMVDLPIESLVMSGEYDSDTKTIILTLQDNTKIKIPLSDLISGLVTTEDLSNKVETKLINAKEIVADNINGITAVIDTVDTNIINAKKKLETPYIHNSENIDISTPKALRIGHTSQDVSFDQDVENTLEIGQTIDYSYQDFEVPPTVQEDYPYHWYVNSREEYTKADMSGRGSGSLYSGSFVTFEKQIDSAYTIGFTALTTGRSKVWFKIEHKPENSNTYTTVKSYVAGSNSQSNSFASLIRSDNVWKTFSLTLDQPLGNGYLKFTFGSDNDADSAKGLYINTITITEATGLANVSQSTYIRFTEYVDGYDAGDISAGGIEAYVKGKKALALKGGKTELNPGNVLNINMGEAENYSEAQSYIKFDTLWDNDFKIALNGRRMIQLNPSNEQWEQSFIDSSKFKLYSSEEIELASCVKPNSELNISDSDDCLTPKVRKPGSTLLLGYQGDDSRLLTYEGDLAVGVQYAGTKPDPDEEDGTDEIFHYYADKGENPNAGLKISEYYGNSGPEVEVFGSPRYRSNSLVSRKFYVDNAAYYTTWRRGLTFNCRPNKFTYSKLVINNTVSNGNVSFKLQINRNEWGIEPGQYLIFSNIDEELGYNWSLDSSYKYMITYEEIEEEITITYKGLSVGEHFITIKGVNNSLEYISSSNFYCSEILFNGAVYDMSLVDSSTSDIHFTEYKDQYLPVISNPNVPKDSFMYSELIINNTIPNGTLKLYYDANESISPYLSKLNSGSYDSGFLNQQDYVQDSVTTIRQINFDLSTISNEKGSAEYGFVYKDGALESEFKEGSYYDWGYAYAKLTFNVTVTGSVKITYKRSGDSSNCFLLSNLDTELAKDYFIDGNAYYENNEQGTFTVIYNNVPAGEHFITAKFQKYPEDGSATVKNSEILQILSISAPKQVTVDSNPYYSYTNIPVGENKIIVKINEVSDVKKNSFNLTRAVLNEKDVDLSKVNILTPKTKIYLKKYAEGVLPRVGIGIARVDGELQRNLDNDNMCMVFRPDGIVDIRNTITKHEDEFKFNLDEINKGKVRIIADALELNGKNVSSDPIVYTNVRVAKLFFTEDNAYEGYPYKATIPLERVTANMLATVIFDVDGESKFARFCETYDGGIYLWSISNEGTVIPSIKLEPVEALDNNGSGGLEFTSNGDGTCSVTKGTFESEDVIIPMVSSEFDLVTAIGEDAFTDCLTLKNVAIANSVKEIQGFAFNYCESLINIIIPDSVVKIDNYVFQYCASLTEIRYTGTIAQWNTINKGANWNSEVSITKIICSDGEVLL